MKPASAGVHQHSSHGSHSPSQGGREGEKARALSAVVGPSEPPAQLPFNATLEPLTVSLAEAEGPRAPTMPECEIIIRHLQQVNDKQAHEVGYHGNYYTF